MNAPQSLDQALALFQADPPVLVKNRAGQVGNQKTRYADLVQVNREVLARLNALGVIYTCRPHIDGTQFGLHYRLVHAPTGEAIEGVYPLKLSENPQQMGSAITYARRYVLLAITGVAAEDDDDDGHAGRPVAQRARPVEQPAQRQAQRATPPLPGEQPGDRMSPAQQRRMMAQFGERGMSDRAERLAYCRQVIGRDIGSASELTGAEARAIIDALAARIAPPPTADELAALDAQTTPDDWPDVATPGGDQ